MAFVATDENSIMMATALFPDRTPPDAILRYTYDNHAPKTVCCYTGIADDARFVNQNYYKNDIGNVLKKEKTRLIAWYGEPYPSAQQVFDIYPSHDIAFKVACMIAESDEARHLHGQTVSMRNRFKIWNTEHEDGRSMARIIIKRFMNGSHHVPASFLRLMFSEVEYGKDWFSHPDIEQGVRCILCCINFTQGVHKCVMRMPVAFMDINVYIAKPGEHSDDSASLLKAETSFCGTILDTGHVVTYHDCQGRVYTAMARCVRAARSCATQ